MESTSHASESASEEHQRVVTATPDVQSTEVRSQLVQHGGNEDGGQTRDHADHDLALAFNEATDSRADVEEDKHLLVKEIKDDVSIASSDLREQKHETPDNFRDEHSDSLTAAYKSRGTKYARAAAIYTEGLENRVRVVEKELLELQYEFGSKEKPNSDKENDEVNLNSPCAYPLPLKVMQLSLNDWKDRCHSHKWDQASIFLATTTGTPSFQLGSIDPSQGTNLRPSDKVSKYDNDGNAAGIQRPESSNIARLAFSSPWPLILIELLNGEWISEGATWVYPFKHIVIYEKQIRKFVELLNGTNVNDVKAKDLAHTLGRIVSEVVRILGPKKEDINYTEIYVSQILQRRQALKNHFKKLKKSSSVDQEEQRDDTESESGLSSTSPVDDSTSKIAERSPPPSETSFVPEEVPCVCTCLKDARDHLQLLVNTIDSHFGPLLQWHKAVRDRVISKISFEHLWHLFQPGDLVVTSRQPHQAYRVIHISGGRPLARVKGYKDDEEIPPLRWQSRMPSFSIDCVSFDFDGEKFGPVQDTVRIFEYKEEKEITKLDVFPISYGEKEKNLSQSLLERGQHFAEYYDFQHRRYEGLSLSDPPEEIESEVIIDFTQALRQPGYAKHKPLMGLHEVTRASPLELYEDICSASQPQCLQMSHNSLLKDTEIDKLQMDHFLNLESREMFLESRRTSPNLTKDQLVLLPYRVQGFSLRSRQWVPLNINLLQEIKENDSLDGRNSGFYDLVIPDEYKKIVKALVMSHTLGSRSENRDRQQIDLIRGKGKGLIILLHGVPGVGKTSTAESVASYTGRPLFPITCGDIGQTASVVERNLEAIFLLARKWGCVLLLDEADVFLAKRERGGDSIARNALVSVFLRTLEYYSGILFLTTNRIGSFDEAFKSRIHVSLYYAPLSESQTFEVWTMNLNRLSKSKRNVYVDRSEIEAFARSHWKDGTRWNGRQIRNAFQTAVALAEYEFQEKCQKCEQTGDKPPIKPALEDQHFSTVAKTSAEFDDYLQSVMGGHTYENKAQISEMRSDAYNPDVRGTETPSGKKYGSQRAVRPSRSGEQPAVRDSEAFTKQTVTPPVTPQLLSTGSMTRGAVQLYEEGEEEEEYRLFKAEQQRQEKQKAAEKTERFRKMLEAERMGR